MKALYCDSTAMNYLWATTPAAPPPLPGSAGDLFGIPVIVDPGLPFSGWQLRDDDEVLAEGRFFEEPEPLAFELPSFTLTRDYDSGYLSDWRWQALIVTAS